MLFKLFITSALYYLANGKSIRHGTTNHEEPSLADLIDSIKRSNSLVGFPKLDNYESEIEYSNDLLNFSPIEFKSQGYKSTVQDISGATGQYSIYKLASSLDTDGMKETKLTGVCMIITQKHSNGQIYIVGSQKVFASTFGNTVTITTKLHSKSADCSDVFTSKVEKYPSNFIPGSGNDDFQDDGSIYGIWASTSSNKIISLPTNVHGIAQVTYIDDLCESDILEVQQMTTNVCYGKNLLNSHNYIVSMKIDKCDGNTFLGNLNTYYTSSSCIGESTITKMYGGVCGPILPDKNGQLVTAGSSQATVCLDPDHDPNIYPAGSPTTLPEVNNIDVKDLDDGDASCFAASETVTMESGDMKMISDVIVGDRVLASDINGKTSFSNVIAVPHTYNMIETNFIQIKTSTGNDIKMTSNHLLPSNTCDKESFSLIKASNIKVGSCIQSMQGQEQVTSINIVSGKGIYTIVTNEEYVVVNGIIVSPFAGNHQLGHQFYNIIRLIYKIFPNIITSKYFIIGFSSFSEFLRTVSP